MEDADNDPMTDLMELASQSADYCHRKKNGIVQFVFAHVPGHDKIQFVVGSDAMPHKKRFAEAMRAQADAWDPPPAA